MNIFINEFISERVNNYQDIEDIIETRRNEFGAYSLLENKSIEEVNKFKKLDIVRIINGLYSTQRPSVEKDLLEILDYNETSGLKFYKGLINRIKKAKTPLDIEQLHPKVKEDIKYYGYKLKFGKGTLSQIAHFCEPDKYAIYNTKSKRVILEIFNENVDNNMLEFVKYSNEIVGWIEHELEHKFIEFDLEYIHKNRYIILDEFVEYVFELVTKEN